MAGVVAAADAAAAGVIARAEAPAARLGVRARSVGGEARITGGLSAKASTGAVAAGAGVVVAGGARATEVAAVVGAAGSHTTPMRCLTRRSHKGMRKLVQPSRGPNRRPPVEIPANRSGRV